MILFVCRDPNSAIRGRCFNYFFSLLIREDPPRNFPWDKALSDLRRYGIDAREVIFTYVDESKAIFWYIFMRKRANVLKDCANIKVNGPLDGFPPLF